jgi:PAS domain S-box-containing protein
MPDQVEPVSGENEQTLQAEIARLNKIIQALMNRAERNASIQGSDFNLFHTAITLEDQVRRRTGELEAARLENEKITRALRESENRNRLLVENSPMGIHEIGMDGRIISMNTAGLLMFGLKEERETKGSLYLNAVSAADRERIGELFAKAHTGETCHFEFKSSGLGGLHRAQESRGENSQSGFL